MRQNDLFWSLPAMTITRATRVAIAGLGTIGRVLARRLQDGIPGLTLVCVAAQDRVAFLDKNSPEFFEVLFGAAKLNAVTVAVNWRLAPREAAYIVNDAEATVLVVGEELLPLAEAMEPELTTVKKVVVVGHHPRHDSYEAWLAGQASKR